MKTTLKKLEKYASPEPSKWKDEAKFRQLNKGWLRYSQMIAVIMLDKMEKNGFTQKKLAEKMGCSQQYISKILQGKENLSLETLYKIESALECKIILEVSHSQIGVTTT